MASHIAILAECHSELLRVLSNEADKTFEGLHQASSFLMAPQRLRKKMQRLETAYHVCRHITQARTQLLQTEVSEWLRERRLNHDRVVSMHSEPQFYDISDLVHSSVQTDLSIGSKYVVREVWPEDPGFPQCLTAISRHDDSPAPSPNHDRHEGPLGEVGRHQTADRVAGRSGEEHRCHRYGDEEGTRQEGCAVSVAFLFSSARPGLGAAPQPGASWQVLASSCQIVSSVAVGTFAARHAASQPFSAQGQPQAAAIAAAIAEAVPSSTIFAAGEPARRRADAGRHADGLMRTEPTVEVQGWHPSWRHGVCALRGSRRPDQLVLQEGRAALLSLAPVAWTRDHRRPWLWHLLRQEVPRGLLPRLPPGPPAHSAGRRPFAAAQPCIEVFSSGELLRARDPQEAVSSEGSLPTGESSAFQGPSQREERDESPMGPSLCGELLCFGPLAHWRHDGGSSSASSRARWPSEASEVSDADAADSSDDDPEIALSGPGADAADSFGRAHPPVLGLSSGDFSGGSEY